MVRNNTLNEVCRLLLEEGHWLEGVIFIPGEKVRVEKRSWRSRRGGRQCQKWEELWERRRSCPSWDFQLVSWIWSEGKSHHGDLQPSESSSLMVQFCGIFAQTGRDHLPQVFFMQRRLPNVVWKINVLLLILLLILPVCVLVFHISSLWIRKKM